VISRTQEYRDPKALTLDVAEATRAVVRAAMDDQRPRLSASLLAALVGVDSTRVDAWFRGAHVPLYLLGHPRVPAAFALRVVADLLAARAEAVRTGRRVAGPRRGSRQPCC
jgi:hypothetical protein